MDEAGILVHPPGIRLPAALVRGYTRGHRESGEETGPQPGEADKKRVLGCGWPHEGGTDPGKGVEVGILQYLPECHEAPRGVAQDAERPFMLSYQLSAAVAV